MWIGKESELKALNLWQHRLIIPWHQDIKNGHSVIEALRSGVELDPLDSFMNIDDMVILRDMDLSNEQRRKVIINAFRQLGKAYDFNFDVTNSDRIVCSELVYYSYLHIQWPIEKTLGRYTISPDHIALKVKNNELQVIKLYLNGQEIKQNKYDIFNQLLN